ncbi:hypothetical protein ACH5RR_040841 [Cinchona calisaya]|uniref:Uncharacterized protein n=1 Tax=Cinchona calisaya TaxID=153742 RepID=A0ABD2XXX1_9GENT
MKIEALAGVIEDNTVPTHIMDAELVSTLIDVDTTIVYRASALDSTIMAIRGAVAEVGANSLGAGLSISARPSNSGHPERCQTRNPTL